MRVSGTKKLAKMSRMCLKIENNSQTNPRMIVSHWTADIYSFFWMTSFKKKKAINVCRSSIAVFHWGSSCVCSLSVSCFLAQAEEPVVRAQYTDRTVKEESAKRRRGQHAVRRNFGKGSDFKNCKYLTSCGKHHARAIILAFHCHCCCCCGARMLLLYDNASFLWLVVVADMHLLTHLLTNPLAHHGLLPNKIHSFR